MRTELEKLIARVTESKANLEKLAGLQRSHENNKQRSTGCKVKFYVSGMNDDAAVCLDEELFFSSVKSAFESEKKLMADDYKTLEAMELLVLKQNRKQSKVLLA